MLVSELETLCRDSEIIPGQEPLDSLVDSAFDATLPAGLVVDYEVLPEHHKSKEPLDDRAIRDAFLRFFCALLRGYERFLVVPDADFLIRYVAVGRFQGVAVYFTHSPSFFLIMITRPAETNGLIRKNFFLRLQRKTLAISTPLFRPSCFSLLFNAGLKILMCTALCLMSV